MFLEVKIVSYLGLRLAKDTKGRSWRKVDGSGEVVARKEERKRIGEEVVAFGSEGNRWHLTL